MCFAIVIKRRPTSDNLTSPLVRQESVAFHTSTLVWTLCVDTRLATQAWGITFIGICGKRNVNCMRSYILWPLEMVVGMWTVWSHTYCDKWKWWQECELYEVIPILTTGNNGRNMNYIKSYILVTNGNHGRKIEKKSERGFLTTFFLVMWLKGANT